MTSGTSAVFYRVPLTLLLSLSLAACGGGGSDSSGGPSTPGSSSSSGSSGSSGGDAAAEPSLVVAINAGSGTSASYSGVDYQRDQYSTGGQLNSTTDPISGTTEDALFQTERYGSFGYRVPVTEGTYTVELHLVELYWKASDERSFNLSIEGKVELAELDIFSQAGHDGAFNHTVEGVQVTDGFLDIELEPIKDSGTLSGFALYSLDGELDSSAAAPPEESNEPGVATDENTGGDCPVASLPEASDLLTVEKLPDPFTKLDGERLTTKEEWRCRRAEINAQLQKYESGRKPSKPANVAGTVTSEDITVNVQHGNNSISFSANVSLPTGGQAPYPAVIGVGASNLDNGYLSSQGVAVITFDNNEMGAQSGAGSRGTGKFFDLYGSDHSASSITAWAWGISRLIDVIEESGDAMLDPARLGVTGCSRNGKGALLAGALDERIALTIPQEAGAGGSASWRVSQAQADAGMNVQTLSNAAGEQPWFRASFGLDFGNSNVTRLPIDHHQVMGMVAPRGLLILDNDIDWLGPLSGYLATSAAKEIYTALGVPENIAYSENGGHGHCQFPSHQQAVLSAYVQKFLLGGSGDTEVMQSTKGDSAAVTEWVDWSTPNLQ